LAGALKIASDTGDGVAGTEEQGSREGNAQEEHNAAFHDTELTPPARIAID